MPRKALAATKKAQICRETHDGLMARAVALYQAELAKPDVKARSGLRTICKQVEREHYVKTQRSVSLNHNTLRNLVNGGRLRSQANAEKGWLLPAETEQVIKFTTEMADWGHPLSHRRLKEHVDEILRARLGNRFPATGVGVRWTQRFVEKHSERLHVYTAKPLDSLRGQAVNEHANAKYFDMVEEVQLRGDDGSPIAPECTYAMDEIGFSPNGDEGYEKVIGGKGKAIQYQQRKGSCENITVLVTICADGTALPPAVIFKGKGYCVRWRQDNPADAMIGHSKKGWTNNAIGIEYGKHFESLSRPKARGRTRSLYLDGHNSHASTPFLGHCIENKVKVPGYPYHGTHVYQSLDVVVFSPLKTQFGKERDEHLRQTGEPITKENFLQIYGRAHLKILTPELIKTAFRKVGIVPVDRRVVTPLMMAPSRDTSFKYFTPVEPNLAVKAVTDLIIDTAQTSPTSSSLSSPAGEDSDAHGDKTPPPSFPARVAVNQLRSTDMRALVSESPMKSSTEPPIPAIYQLSPVRAVRIRRKPERALEKRMSKEELLDELEILKAERELFKATIAQQQADIVVQRLYCGRVRKQLGAKELKAANRGNGGYLSDDEAPLMTGSKFMRKVKAREDRVAGALRQKAEREQQKASYDLAMENWKKSEEERKNLNEELGERWKAAVEEWKMQKAAAKAKGTKVKDWVLDNPCPKRNDPDFKARPALPKPKLTDGIAEDPEDDGYEVFDLSSISAISQCDD